MQENEHSGHPSTYKACVVEIVHEHGGEPIVIAAVPERLIQEATQVVETCALDTPWVTKSCAADVARDIKQDIDAGRKVVQELISTKAELPREPEEKFISFDAMPAPLKRIVKAYMDLEAAQKELDAAVVDIRR